MRKLDASDFPAFFAAVNGPEQTPFPWQQRLTEHVITTKQWPRTLALPTGSGKMSALDIAVFALACEQSAGESAMRSMPVRMVFVVDRRLIVDAAYDHACKLARVLRTSVDPVVVRVAAALRRLCGEHLGLDAFGPLHVARLRGGAPREGDWTPSPTFPTILLSTVDQVGSRLLFRGYGVTESMRPVHAGLLGDDALIILDEVHLAEPFRQTLEAVARARKAETGPWSVVDLSATPRTRHGTVFVLDDADRRCANLSRRLTARKPTTLVTVDAATESGLAARYAEIAIEQSSVGAGRAERILVVVNRVALARRIFEALAARLKNQLAASPDSVQLLIGRAREVDKTNIRDVVLKQTASNADRAQSVGSVPFFLVATQTVEAGADLDFDALVTQVAPLDSLRQRFGRVDRIGRLADAGQMATGIIVGHAGDLSKKSEPDAIYGAAPREVWSWLQELHTAGSLDFGNEVMDQLLLHLDPAKRQLFDSPVVDAPTLMPSYLRHLQRTRPTPSPDLNIGLFLHGPNSAPADVQIVWRADVLDPRVHPNAAEDVEALLDALPPRTAEAIAVPIWAARRFLRLVPGDPSVPIKASMTAAAESAGDSLADTVRSAPSADTERSGGATAWRWKGGDDDVARVTGAEIAPGDLIVVPAAYGGCDRFGWAIGDAAVTFDVAERAAEAYAQQTFAFRLHPALVEQHLLVEHAEEARKTPRAFRQRLERVWKTVAARIGDAATAKDIVEAFSENDPLAVSAGFARALDALRGASRLGIVDVYPEWENVRGGVLLVAPSGLSASQLSLLNSEATGDDDGEFEASTEDDERSTKANDLYLLTEHGRDVSRYAGSFAELAALKPQLRDDVALAGELHDIGKADRRFQRYLLASRWDQHSAPLAKSTRARTRSADRAARAAASLPQGWRHEAHSVRIAREHPRFAQANDPELVLWLIGSHHGWGRPLFLFQDSEDARVVSFDDVNECALTLGPTVGPGHAEFAIESVSADGQRLLSWARLFERVSVRYGIWGLARLESFVRLADHRASALHSRQAVKVRA